MTHVHYKFSSKLSYDTVVFDGSCVTLRELKGEIMGREKLRARDCELQITDAQTKQEYTDDEGLISKGCSVIVRRIPISGGRSSSSSKTYNKESSCIQLHHTFRATKAMDTQSSPRTLPIFAKMANLADADVSEEDKIKTILNQSTYDALNYNKKSSTVLPANYTCFRCGSSGHHIRNCPTTGQDKNFEAPLRIKKSTGIPRSFMVEVNDPSVKGAMLTSCGRYAIPAIDAEAYAIGKKERPPFLPQTQSKAVEEDPIPDELLCPICHDLLNDAVVIPCCGNSYCDECIRTALLDSEEHVCPTCSQSNVSPDTLIANKFLRQAVNNFKKERGFIKSLKSCGTSQSQNPTPTPSHEPTPPPFPLQRQPQKPDRPAGSQEDSLLLHSEAADTLPLSGSPPVTTGPTSACSTPGTSLQPEHSHLELHDKEAEEATQNDSAAAASQSVLVPDKEPTAAPLQLIPVVKRPTVAEQPQSVSVDRQQSSLGSAPRHSGPSSGWDSSSSSSGCPTRGWTNSQQFTSSSFSYSASAPHLLPSPLFLSAHQSHSTYSPGYPHTTPSWTIPNPQGAPIPSLCPPTSTTSFSALETSDWYSHQRKEKQRSPPRGSACRRSSSSKTKTKSKSKSSCSYSRSSSRSGSRSRSRSQGRSRPRSPYSQHRNVHTRSHPSRSSNSSYKRSRSPTLSSSSSPQVGYYYRSKSPSDHRKKHHHSRHQNRKSASGSSSSRRRGEPPRRETGGSEGGLASCLYAQYTNQPTSLDVDRERYLLWKKEYKEWCEKYFSGYASHFHQPPLPLLTLPPPPQWGGTEGNKSHSNASSDSRHRPQDGHTAQMDERSPSSQSSSDSRSSPSKTSSDSRSTSSQSFSNSHSSPSYTSSDSRSPASQSSSDGCSTPCEDRADPRSFQQNVSHLPSRHTPTSTEKVKLTQRSEGEKQLNMKNLEDLSSLKHNQRGMKKHEKGRGKESSIPTADSADERRKDETGHDTGPNACKDGTPVQDGATASHVLESVQPPLEPNKSLDKDGERKSRKQRNLEVEKRWGQDKDSDSKQEVARQHNVKASKEADRMDTGKYRNLEGIKACDTRWEKNRKRKGDDIERNKTCKSESPDPFDGKKQNAEKKKERKTVPLTERDIWEGGITVKPLKKINIYINLDAKRKEEKTEQERSYSEGITGKAQEEIEKTGDGEEEKLKRGSTEAQDGDKMLCGRAKEGVFEEIKSGEVGAQEVSEKGTIIDNQGEKISGGGEYIRERKEHREEEDFDLWHCALRGAAEEKSKNQREEGDRTKTSKEEVTRDQRRTMMEKEEGEERTWNESQGKEVGELVQNCQKEKAERDSTCTDNRGHPPGESKPEEELKEGKEEDAMGSRLMSRCDRSKTAVDDGSCEDLQERTAQDRAAEGEDELVLIQVPRSKLEKEEPEEEEEDGEIAPVVPTSQETEEENVRKSQRSVDMERDRDRALQRGRDREEDEDGTMSSSNRSVAPSSGKDGPKSSLCTDREREKGVERRRDRERGRESDRQKVGKRPRERRREEEREKDRWRGRERSSTISAQKRNLPSSGHSSSMSHDTERRDRQHGGRRERSSISRAAKPPDQNAYKTYKDTILDSKCKDKNHDYRDQAQNYRPAGTHHSSSLRSHSQGKNRDQPRFECFGPKPRMSSSGWEFIQNRSRNESKDETGVWKPDKVDEVMKESKEEQEAKGMETEREGGSRWEDETDKVSKETKWEGERELEEGERSSSRSSGSSARQDHSKDGRGKEKKKHKRQRKHKKEGRGVMAEQLEGGELKTH